MEKEVWENSKKGPIYVRVIVKGEEKLTRVIGGGRVSVTPEERELNQLKVRSKDGDFFSNGDLVPVKLVESAADYEEVASNPNTKSPDELKDLFSLKVQDFCETVDEINNPRVIERMLDISEEIPRVSKNKLSALSDRLEELNPKPEPIQSDVDDADTGESVE